MRRTLTLFMAILALTFLTGCSPLGVHIPGTGGPGDDSTIGVTVNDGKTPAQHINIKLGNKDSWRLGILGNNKDLYNVELGLRVVKTSSKSDTTKFETKSSVELHDDVNVNGDSNKRWIHAVLIRGRYQILLDGKPQPVIIDVAEDGADLKKLRNEFPKPAPKPKPTITGENLIGDATPSSYWPVEVINWGVEHDYTSVAPDGKYYYTKAQELSVDLTKQPYVVVQFNLSLNGGGIDVRLRPNKLEHPELNRLLYLEDIGHLSANCSDCKLMAILTPGTYQLTLNGAPSDTTVVVRSTPATDFTDVP